MEFTMSKIKWPTASASALITTPAFRLVGAAALIAGLAFVLAAPFCASAQAQTTGKSDVTISDLANAQGAKLRDEIAKAQGLPTQQDRVAVEAQAAVAAEAQLRMVKARPAPTRSSSTTVHGTYTARNGSRVIELTDGRNLFQAKVGAQYGEWIITDVTATGVTIASAVCKKKCRPDRAVSMGGTF